MRNEKHKIIIEIGFLYHLLLRFLFKLINTHTKTFHIFNVKQFTVVEGGEINGFYSRCVPIFYGL